MRAVLAAALQVVRNEHQGLNAQGRGGEGAATADTVKSQVAPAGDTGQRL